MMRARFAHLALLPLATLGAACQTDTVACQQDSDCFLTERCSAGFCEARPSTDPDTGADADSDSDVDADTGDEILPPPDLDTICRSSQRPPDTGRYLPSAVSAGPEHVCAIDADGRLLCWGQNSKGQLGDGTLEPRLVPTRVGQACRWSFLNVGDRNTCAITIDSQLFCWGDNRFGQLGQGDFVDRHLPVQIPGEWATVAVGPDRMCARNNESDTWCWGNSGIRRNLLGAEGLDLREPSPVRIIDEFDALDITMGDAHTCVRKRSTDELYCWGDNNRSQIGPELPVAGSPTPHISMLNFSWSYISAAGDHTCGLVLNSDDRNMYCWGEDAAPYGLDAPDSQEAPHFMGADDHFGLAIHTSSTHTCSVDFNLSTGTYGGLLCWGGNGFGQVSPGNPASQFNEPHPVSLPVSEIYYAALAEGLTCVLSGEPPSLHCWGDNQQGRLATGNTEAQPDFVTISLAPR